MQKYEQDTSEVPKSFFNFKNVRSRSFFLVFSCFYWISLEIDQSGSKKALVESEVVDFEAAKKMFETSPYHVMGTQGLL